MRASGNEIFVLARIEAPKEAIVESMATICSIDCVIACCVADATFGLWRKGAMRTSLRVIAEIEYWCLIVVAFLAASWCESVSVSSAMSTEESRTTRATSGSVPS